MIIQLYTYTLYHCNQLLVVADMISIIYFENTRVFKGNNHEDFLLTISSYTTSIDSYMY
jgi:hypothetical protein